METLDLPTITGFETPAAITAVAAAASTALDLRKVDLTDVALAQFGEWRKDVAAVKANLSTLALELVTQTNVDEAKSLRWRLIGVPRAGARATAKELKSKLAKVSKAIGAEEDAIVLAWDEAESLITPHIDARQAELDAEKAAAAAAKAEAARLEAERRQRHEDGITTLAGYVGKAKGKTAAQIAKGIEFVAGIPIDPAHWQEYTERAAVTLAKTRETLREMLVAQVKAEADAAELEALRAEKAEREARERAVREAELAAARAESDRLERLAEENRKAMAAAAPKAPDSEMTAAWSLPKTEPAPPPVEAPAAEPEPQPILINLGEFSRRLGFIVNAALLSDFGIEPTTTHKAAKLYHPSEWPRLCDALTAHIKAKREAY